MNCSVTTIRSLVKMPLRRCQNCLRCVVVTVRTLPFHLPVEKPCHVCGAYFDGCCRPSIHTIRDCANVDTNKRIARSACVFGSRSSENLIVAAFLKTWLAPYGVH